MSKELDKQAVDYALILQAFPTPYMVLRANPPFFTIVAVSETYLCATQTQREQLIDKNLFEVFPDNPIDHSATGVSDLHISLNQVIQNRTPDVMGVQRYDIHLPDNQEAFQVKYWSVVNAPVLDKQGEVEYIVHRAEDVTQFMLLQQKMALTDQSNDASEWALEAEILRGTNEVKDANRRIKSANDELERKKSELVTLNERLKAMDQAKTEFFSNISHEFRTPLTLMLGPIEEELKASNVASLTHHRMKMAYRNAARLLKLVNTLLDFSRLEAGRLQAVYCPMDIAKLTAELASHFDSTVEKSGIKLIINCPPLPEPIYIDKSLYEKIVFNLISNAFKNTVEGEIEVRTQWVGNGVKLTVRDTGIGIPEDQMIKIFERFHQVANAKARSYEGSGIGLSLVKELVNMHHGVINVASTLNKGSTFSVYFKAGNKHLPPEQIQAQAATTSELIITQSYIDETNHWFSTQAETLHPVDDSQTYVLLADDNNDMRAYIKELLEPYYKIIAVTNGIDALALARQHKPQLILSDVMMPRMNGFELVNELRQDPSLHLIPIILLSARTGEEAKIAGLETGADDYLIKPFSAMELLTRVKTHLNLQKIRLESQEALRKSEERYHLLYEWERKTREAMLIFQQRLDINGILANAVEQMGLNLNIDYVGAIHSPSEGVFKVAHEYRKNSQESSLLGKPLSADFILTKSDNSLQQGGNTLIHIYYEDEMLAAFILRHENDSEWSSQEQFFISTLIEQLKISLYQAKITAHMEKASKLKNQFISNMSHELRTPLNAIIGYSAMILQGMANSSEKQHKFVSNISSAGKHLLALINDILDLSKIEAGKFTLNIKEITVKHFISDIQTLLKELAASNKVHLAFMLDPDIDELNADPVRLKQILINLLNNAIKFNKEDGKVTLAIEKSSDGKWVNWKITDTGIGIPHDKLGELFTEFYQVDNSSSRSYEGTGLGLALTKHLVQLHGGSITVDSKENEGSTFIFTIPYGDNYEQSKHTNC